MFLNWTTGRQNSGYSRLTLFQFNIYKFKIDSHFIKFPKGSFIPEHVDTVDNFKHYRLNAILKKPLEGGVFYSEKIIFSLFGRIFFFRPDKHKHSVSKIMQGERIVFSLGFATKKT